VSKDLGMHERNMLIPEIGDTILVSKNSIKKSGVVPSGIKLVDGYDISDAGGIIQRDRVQLASEGFCIVTITISSKFLSLSSKPDIFARGFISLKDHESVMEEARELILNQVISTNFKTQDWAGIKNNLKKSLQSFFFKKLKRRPLIVPLIIETK
jgi:ribonuclease J